MLRVLLLSTSLVLAGASHARDNGQWDSNPELKKWYSELMQPDNPTASCCGEADAYFCDSIHVRDGVTYCNIDDDRVVKNRTPRPVGMEIEIPDRKLMDGRKTRGNPTGHSVVFLSSGTVPVVYCFVQGSGI